ncbi:UBA/TS-N domain-containing protein [Pochonia chlamydosporia 170]|uniref:UBA/TS-N domain-containing protein n=1 Tax=Pochonia chlamydosporia 170 TaxID=1380566 RepID=A0A179G5I6_METCM|nr:UBA/TS-N domain-containing protein [Pochonia chlamydosporia 170]OAQ73086.2 UBA/TS-N domain-containing protein [Pochonia chlamydosporia 170]
MSADAGADSAAPPNLNLSPEEKRVYGQLFRQADTESVGVVTGEVAVKFFEKTRLDSRVLGEIWQIADNENRGFLTPAGFGIVLRLIGHAQAGREPTAEIALQQGPIPRFDGLWPPPSLGSPTSSSPAPLQAQSSGGPVRIPPLTPDKVAQYTGLFERQPLQAGKLPGEQARNIFDKSGLPNEILGRIWALADTEQRGSLVLPEFVIAMHLLTSMKTGTLRSLPTVLPPALYEVATSRGAAPRQSPSNTGMGPIPRQLSGSAQMRTGSPLGRPPVGPQAGGDWAVSASDKAKFDQIYATIDKTNKGYITGEEAVPFFSQSNLSEEALAQIWDLADFNSQGQLTREGFAVAMYLIRQQRSGTGGSLPSALPANLIPPSVRNQRQPPPFPAPVARVAPPQPKSALDDLFGLESTPSPAPAPTQTTMSTGGSNSNDPFAGGSAILPPSSPVRSTNTGTTFKPFVPSSSFGRGLAGPSQGDMPKQTEDLLEDNDPEASKNITGETTELANLSSQIGTLSKQMQDVQNKRTTTQGELNQTNSQKQNFEQRLAQLRALYEKEAEDTRSLEEQLRKSRAETQKLQSDCMTLEGTLRDVQSQHQQLGTALQADQQENASLRERIRVVNGEIAKLKPQIEKLKSDSRQQKGLVAINKKQLVTTEGERDKLKNEAEELTKGNEEAARAVDSSSPTSATAQIASPALSTASGNNPFFKRTASTDIMGAFASPPARSYTDKSFDDVFGPSFGAGSNTSTPPPPAFQQQQHTGTSAASGASFHTGRSSPNTSRQGTLNMEPPAPPASRQISSSFLPFPDTTESLSSSRQVSPPASRADGPSAGSTGESTAEEGEKSETPGATPVAAGVPAVSVDEAASKAKGEDAAAAGPKPDPFGGTDQAKAKADFDNAFAAFTASGKGKATGESDANKSTDAFNTEFPPISELERDEDESESESERGGFDDDFTAASPANKGINAKETQAAETKKTEETSPSAAPQVPAKEPVEDASKSSEQPSSPATVTGTSQPTLTADDIFGAAAPGPVPPKTTGKGVFDDLDDDFEGLEDAKEGSADDDFANISRDDFNPVFDSSPPASQAKTGSTTQQKTADSHDWDAIFAGLDSPNNITPPGGAGEGSADKQGERPGPPGRALTEQGEHDDPILKSLTSMGYSRSDAVAALEKYDYNLEKAANYLASKS